MAASAISNRTFNSTYIERSAVTGPFTAEYGPRTEGQNKSSIVQTIVTTTVVMSRWLALLNGLLNMMVLEGN